MLASIPSWWKTACIPSWRVYVPRPREDREAQQLTLIGGGGGGGRIKCLPQGTRIGAGVLAGAEALWDSPCRDPVDGSRPARGRSDAGRE
jgi:hypothetical protein